MTAARHKAVREHPLRRRLARLGIPALAATAVTGTVIGVSVADVDTAPTNLAASNITRPVGDRLDALERLEDRGQNLSRAARRVTLDEKPEVVAHRFSTVALNVRTEPSEDAKLVETLELGTKVGITGETKGPWAQIVLDRHALWVSGEYLAKKKPEPEETAPDPGDVEVTGPCTAAPPSGVTSAATAVYEAVCSRFPMISTYGGYRPDGEHSSGQAVDIMVSGDLGWQIADYLRSNASTFGLYDIIYSQRIWTAERSSEGWRYMSDRGSTTANHYDHVHVKVY